MEVNDLTCSLSQNGLEKRREYLKQGLDLAKDALARENSGVTLENLPIKAFDLAVSLAGLYGDIPRTFPETLPPSEPDLPSPEEVMRSVGEKSIKCLICGKEFRLLSSRHLAEHGLTPAEYREKFGFPKRFGLCCLETKKIRAEVIPKDKLTAARSKKRAEAQEAAKNELPKDEASKEKKARTQKPKATPQVETPEVVETSEVTDTFEATEGTNEE